MAGGEGTRLRPLTSNQPKPMVPVVGKPCMEHIIELLRDHGFDEVIVTLAFMPQAIRSYFGDGEGLGLAIEYSVEESPLGTAGSVRLASEKLDETFLVISGDALCDVDLSEIMRVHREREAAVTIGLKSVDNPLEFGIVVTDEDGRVERFLEKPSWGQVFSDTINTGIYVLEPQILDLIPEHEAVDFSEAVFPAALKRGLAIQGLVVDGYWEDVGTVDAYHRAHRDVLDQRVAVDIPGFRLGDGIWLGEGADVDPAAEITGPVIIGDNCRVEAGASIGEYTVLGSNVVVKHDASLARTVVHDHVYIGPGAHLRGCIVGRSADLRRGARAEEGVVLGEECFVGDGAVINQNVKVYPYKTVEAGAVINSSIVWESRGQRTLFGRRGVRGLANVDVTAELAVRLAAAYGTSLKKGSVVCCSRDTSRVGRTLKRAIMAGLNLSGLHVEDLELAPVPLTRFHVRSERAQGGVTVRLSPDDPASVEIRFFDAQGCDIDDAAKRKIERLLARDDFRRAFAGDIGDIVFPPRVLEYYTAALIRSISVEAVREQAFKLVLDTSFGSASVVLKPVLAKLGAEVLAVNPFAAAGEDLDTRLARVSTLVRTSGSHLGVVFDPDGETLRVVDDTGHVLTDEECLLAMVTLVTEARPEARLALPVAVSREAERIAAANGATIAWAKLSTAHLMEVAGSGGIDFATSGAGGYLWPDFLPAADAVATMAKLLDLLAITGRTLSSVVAGLPSVHVAHETVSTPWERKGTVMRTTMEQAQDKELVLVDGIKVLHADGWALVLPDPEEPLTHVWAEGGSEGGARALAQEYVGRIRAALVADTDR